jgi:hypothetical protein
MDACRKGIPNAVSPFGLLQSPQSGGGLLGEHWLAMSSLIVPWVASSASGANPLPTTSVLIPSNGATLSGSTTLDASASNATSVEFRLFGGVYGLNAPVICTATPTYYGWLCSWWRPSRAQDTEPCVVEGPGQDQSSGSPSA